MGIGREVVKVFIMYSRNGKESVLKSPSEGNRKDIITQKRNKDNCSYAITHGKSLVNYIEPPIPHMGSREPQTNVWSSQP
jgi:hypothetical protein